MCARAGQCAHLQQCKVGRDIGVAPRQVQLGRRRRRLPARQPHRRDALPAVLRAIPGLPHVYHILQNRQHGCKADSSTASLQLDQSNLKHACACSAVMHLPASFAKTLRLRHHLSDKACMGRAWKSLDNQTTLAFSGVISCSTSRRALPSYSCQPCFADDAYTQCIHVSVWRPVDDKGLDQWPGEAIAEMTKRAWLP